MSFLSHHGVVAMAEVSKNRRLVESSAGAARLWTREVALLLVAQTLFGFGWSLYLLTPKFLKLQFAATDATLGFVSSTGGLAAVVGMPIAAYGLDRFGKMPFFRIGSAIILAVSLIFLTVDQVGPRVFLAQALNSIAFVFAFNAIATLVADLAPAGRLGEAIGLVGAANMAMNAVATIVAERVSALIGWDAVFSLGAAASVAAVLVSLFVHERKAEPGVIDVGERSALTSAIARISPILVAVLVLGTTFSAVFIFHQAYAVVLDRDAQVWPFFIGFTGVAIFCRLALGQLGDRFGRLEVSLGATIVYAAAAASLMWMRLPLLALHGALFGLGHGLMYPTLNAAVVDMVPVRRRGLAMALFNGIFNAGLSLGGLAWGQIAQRSGYQAVFAGASVMALSAAAILVMLMIVPRSGGARTSGA